MKQWICYLNLLVAFSSPAIAQSTFEYRLNHFDENTPNNRCVDNVRDLATRFAAATGVSIVSSGCFVSEYDADRIDATITYSASEKVVMSKAFNQFSSASDYNGIYKTKAACIADIGTQEAIFLKATGLTAFYSYCYNSSGSTPGLYAIQIDAIGDTPIRHFVSGTYIHGTVDGGAVNLLKEVQQRVQALGLVMNELVIHPSQMWRRLRLGYYAERKLSFYQNSEVRYEKSLSCQADLSATKNRFLQISPNIVGVFCDAGDDLWGTRLNVLELSKAQISSSVYRYKVLPGTYESSVACESDRPHAESALISQGFQLIGLFCGLTPQNKIVMHVFMK